MASMIAVAATEAPLAGIVGRENGLAVSGKKRVQHAKAEGSGYESWEPAQSGHAQAMKRVDRARVEPALKLEGGPHHAPGTGSNPIHP